MKNDVFLKACRREPVPYTPVWLMRQAGRYMKEYMDIRAKHSFLDMCRTPEIACEVTLQPVRRLNVDAAIIFADILLPLEGMGIELEFAKNEGPVINNPIRGAADIDAVRVIEPENDVWYLLEAIRMVKKELSGAVPLIGFSGAPFTLASYIIEGGGSKNYIHTKGLMYGEPRLWHRLMEKITEITRRYLNAQIEAGAEAVQIFDSWAGCLGPDDYREFVLPYTKKAIEGVKKGVPVINFSTNTGTYLDIVKEAGGDVVGVDWRVRLDKAWQIIGHDKAIQGNLDPVALFGPLGEMEKRTKAILDMAGGRLGHIFNLGHGIIVGTPVENVKALVDMVHTLSARGS
ncbi:MAG: uroporphyrinogen decarboxylase [Deltaproteobacteria bacterium]|nr:uroporphyrinogen decarboxylase [Deltaproteobacteria bacterium]